MRRLNNQACVRPPRGMPKLSRTAVGCVTAMGEGDPATHPGGGNPWRGAGGTDKIREMQPYRTYKENAWAESYKNIAGSLWGWIMKKADLISEVYIQNRNVSLYIKKKRFSHSLKLLKMDRGTGDGVQSKPWSMNKSARGYYRCDMKSLPFCVQLS